ncbi:MAG: DUF167 domain-containing protein [Candidatus Moranbacteria bacterium]|nr:DUF167 domain-containing protein [Candidatus Moranbacteria bacterium]
MRIYIKAIPRAGRNELKKISEEEYRAYVVAAPEKGKANEAVVKLLAEYLGISKAKIAIVAGRSIRTKIVDIDK